MAYDGVTNEFEEENKKLDRMTPTERLSYIYNLAIFYKQTREIGEEHIEAFLNRIIKISERYKR